MSVKEDILEQLADDWLQSRGYFTRHNLKFKPATCSDGYSLRHDAVASDIDVIGFHPTAEQDQRVCVVSCKSWQSGFRPETWLDAFLNKKTMSGKPAWKSFRELVEPRWSRAFMDAVEEVTGTRRFTYVTAVTRLRGNRDPWERHAAFIEALEGNPLRILTLREMAGDVARGLSTTVAASHLGRTLQLLKAAGFELAEK